MQLALLVQHRELDRDERELSVGQRDGFLELDGVPRLNDLLVLLPKQIGHRLREDVVVSQAGQRFRSDVGKLLVPAVHSDVLEVRVLEVDRRRRVAQDGEQIALTRAQRPYLPLKVFVVTLEFFDSTLQGFERIGHRTPAVRRRRYMEPSLAAPSSLLPFLPIFRCSGAAGGRHRHCRPNCSREPRS